MSTSPIWITWEHHRRSAVLSKEFGTELCELLTNKKGALRYIILSCKTIYLLFMRRPALLFVQNPSMVLAALACFYKYFSSKTILVVDRHTNFFPISRYAFVNKVLALLSDYTLRYSDLTIVTNQYLKNLVDSKGGRACILQDKIPDLQKVKTVPLKGSHNILSICSFDHDEPYEEVIKAASLLNPDIYVHVTGNYHKIKNKRLIRSSPKNLRFLGFLPENDYIDYLYSVDAVMALTKWDYTLQCGAYEAVAAGKPLILSNKRDLLAYFSKGVICTENDAPSIASAIERLLKDKECLRHNIKLLKKELNEKWQIKFQEATRSIKELQSSC